MFEEEKEAHIFENQMSKLTTEVFLSQFDEETQKEIDDF